MAGKRQKHKYNNTPRDRSVVGSTSSLRDQTAAGQQGQIPPPSTDLSLYCPVLPSALQFSPCGVSPASSNGSAQYHTALQRPSYHPIPPSTQQASNTLPAHNSLYQAILQTQGFPPIVPTLRGYDTPASAYNSPCLSVPHSSQHRGALPPVQPTDYRTHTPQIPSAKSRASAHSTQQVSETVPNPPSTQGSTYQFAPVSSQARVELQWTPVAPEAFTFTPSPQNTLRDHQKFSKSIKTFLIPTSTENLPFDSPQQQNPAVNMVGKKSGKALLREEGTSSLQ
jgi:hypothetical protein